MKIHSLSDICTLSLDTADDGMPEWANLVGGKIVTSSASGDLAGGGVYACFWDEVLIYIGSFVGPKRDPFGGHVADRIYKHVMGLTLRAKALGFSGRPLQSIIENLDHRIARDLEAARKISDRLEHGSIKATFNKARFAKLHWEDLCQATTANLFTRFSFAYCRLEIAGVPVPGKGAIKELWIKPIEQSLIERFQPICNTEFRTEADGKPVGPSEVAKAFDREFARPLRAVSPVPAAPIMRLATVAGGEPDDTDEVEEIIPSDPRWQEYYIDNGQLRVRAVPNEAGQTKGRTLLCRESAKRVVCLADVNALAAVGVEAQRVERGPLKSAVTVDFNGDPGERAVLLRKVLGACVVEWDGRRSP